MPRFKHLAENLKKLETLPSKITKEVAEEIEDLIQDGFEKGQDPYGRPWAPLRRGGRSFLQESGAMRGSLVVQPMRGAGIWISIEDPAGFHLGGTVKMVARPMLPTGDMPESWRRAISDAYGSMMKKAMRR